MPPLDSLPGSLLTPSRFDTRELYLRSYRVRNPSALTTENTFPWIDASCQADLMQVVFRDAVVVNNGVALSTATGEALDQRLEDLGLARLPAIGASGYVTVSASAGGTTIFAGDELKELNSGLRYKCNATALYNNGDPLPVIGIDVGEQTNIDGLTVLTWSSPRPGCNTTAKVVTQADGVSGLTGGHGVESDEDAISRAIQQKANPPASGNDAQYQSTGSATPSIAIQQVFTYPAIARPGSMGFVFTLRPASPGATRVPNGAQVSAVLAYLVGLMPGDDQIFAGTITEQPVSVALRVTWANGAPTWVDTAPWPAYYANPGQAILVSTATSALSFILSAQNGNYSGIAQPSAGQTIGMYDKTAQTFRRKKILSVIGTGPWTIAVDTTNASSDTGYTPIVGQRVCPWSESLNNLPAAVISYFDGLGPGEQVASFFDPGLRQRRSPVSPAFYPHQVSNRLLIPILSLASVQDSVISEPTLPYSTTVGVAGSLSYLLTLGFLAAFPQ